MATYQQLRDLYRSPILRDKLMTAMMIAARAILIDPAPPVNQPDRLKLAAKILGDPEHWAQIVIPLSLAGSAGATVAQIEGASDTAVQDAVNAVLNAIADNVSLF